MPSKISDLNSLFANIYEGAFFVARQRELMPNLVSNASVRNMAPRVMPVYTETTAQTVAEGSAPSEGTLAKTAAGTVTPAIVHHQFVLTDERIMTDPDNARRDAVREIGFAIAKKVDTDGITPFASFTAKKGSAGSALTLANVAAAMSVLMGESVAGGINAVIHPYQWHSLLGQFTNINANPVGQVSDVANDAMREYFVSRYLGVSWYMNANISTTGTAGTAFTYGAMFSPEAILYDERTPLEIEVQRIANKRSWEVNGVRRYGYAIRRDDHGVALRSNAVEPS